MKPYVSKIDEAAGRLASVTSGPRREAEILLAHAVGLDRRSDLFVRDIEPTDEQLARFDDLTRSRAAGTPLQLVLGYVDFYEGRFAVAPSVFIPRPETERLVEACLDAWGPKDHPGRILEIGVGTGVILVSLLLELRRAHGTGVDVSAKALACARGNAERHGVLDRAQLVEGDLFPPGEPAPFDLVVSNPPYVRDDDPLPADVRDYDPAAALFAGADGLDVIRRIVVEAPAWLAPGGLLAMEIGEEQGEAVRGLLESSGSFEAAAVLPDLNQKDRVVTAKRAR